MSGSMVTEDGRVPTQAGTGFGNGLAAGIVATPTDQAGSGVTYISRTISTSPEEFPFPSGAKAVFGRFSAPPGQNTLAGSTASQNIGSGGTTPVVVHALWANTALAASVTINGILNSTGGSTSYAVPAGVVGNLLPTASPMVFASGASVVCSTASDGPRILAQWSPLNDKIRFVVNADSSSDADGKLNTDGAFYSAYPGDQFSIGFARDSLATNVYVRREYGGATPGEFVITGVI